MRGSKPTGTRIACGLVAVVLWGVGPPAGAAAINIDNDLQNWKPGFFMARVQTGGESLKARLTELGIPSGIKHKRIDGVFQYLSFVDPGADGGSFRLLGSDPVLIGEDRVQSHGEFEGAAGNSVRWTATSWIPDGGDSLTTLFLFRAEAGETIGDLRLYRYLDADIPLGPLEEDDDVFATLGSVAGGDLQLLTADDEESIGLSQSGVIADGPGLLAATFEGWAADRYNLIKPEIRRHLPYSLSLAGSTGLLSPRVPDHPVLGPVYGPADIVSVMGWSIDPDARMAAVVTSLGGLPSLADMPEVPEPASAGLLALALAAGLAARRRERRARVATRD